MSELLFLVFIFHAPIILVAIASCFIIVIYALITKKVPDFTKIRAAFLSALLLELQFLIAIIFLVVIFRPASIGYAGPIIMLFGSALLAVGGFLYFALRSIPKWCLWGTWWSLIYGSPRDG
jgi:hypothetical protein